jgi:polysaccharide export outer membrane protein
MTIILKRITAVTFSFRSLAAFCALMLLSLQGQTQGQTQGLSPADIQRLQQLSSQERQVLAEQYRQQQGGAVANSESAAKQEVAEFTDYSAARAIENREQGDKTESAIKTEIKQYRNKVSVPAEALEPFGYALFAGDASTFAPATEIPIPSAYPIGPGDVIRLQLFGQQNEMHELTVSRDGILHLPRVGPVSVAGLDFDEMRRQLTRLVSERFIGVEASITLGKLRSIRIFIMGETRNPGAYTVSSLSNITNALFVSGGVKVSGSLRNVKLIRSGDVIATMDLYDLLLKGDTSSDQRLMPGDVIFIPTVEKTAAIGGQVKRPAVYEVTSEKTIQQLIALAGGYRDEADPRFAKLKRLGDDFQRSVEDMDLTRNASLNEALRNGDELTIGAISDLREGYFQASGAVLRPGLHEWKPGLRVSNVLASSRDGLIEGADLGYSLIVRYANENRDIRIIGFVLGEALSTPGTQADPVLHDRDRILVFEHDVSREALLAPYIEKLSRQVAPGKLPDIVSIGGQVRYPGRYPLIEGMALHELVKAAGGLLDSTYLGEAEVARTSLEAEQAVTSLLDATVDLSRGDVEAFLLQAHDRVLIKRLPAFGGRSSITLEGEVRFPGAYDIRRGEKLSSLLTRAGGLTSHAYAKGAVFSRVSLREQEAARLRELEVRLQSDLAGLSKSKSKQLEEGEGDVSKQLEDLLGGMKSTAPVGRLVIDLKAILAGRDALDVRLLDGDTLTVPEKMQSVTVVGEIQFPTSHLYRANLSVEDYLERSGGSTRNADPGRTYVIRADGSVWLPSRSRWFSGRGGAIEPGDTIVVPPDIEQVNGIELASGLSQIIYQMALGAAAVRGF